MSKLAFIYPGQGAQKAGMGADFYKNSEIARIIYDQAEKVLGLDLKNICFEENDRINLTEYTQPAMVTTCLAMTRVLMAQGIQPDITAGLSLGEYAAVAVTGALSDLEAIRLVRKRGLLMQNAVPAGEGAMCAVLGMSAEAVLGVLEQVENVTIANYNCPGQIVITGKKEAVEQAAVLLKEAGARRTVMLKVSGPFHSPMMVPAEMALHDEIEKVTFGEMDIPYVANVTAKKIEDASLIGELFCKGVSSSVKWQQSVETMILDGVDTFVEIGPGKTLAGFMKKIDREVNIYNVSSWEDIEKVKGALC